MWTCGDCGYFSGLDKYVWSSGADIELNSSYIFLTYEV